MTNPSEHPEQTDNPGNTDNTDAQPTPRTWMRAAAWRKRVLAHEYYRSLDATAREGISDEDYATTMATLEAMARNLGWEESQGMPTGGPGFGPGGWRGRGPHPGHGYGYGYGRGGCGKRRGERDGDAAADKAARKAEKKAAREQESAN